MLQSPFSQGSSRLFQGGWHFKCMPSCLFFLFQAYDVDQPPASLWISVHSFAVLLFSSVSFCFSFLDGLFLVAGSSLLVSTAKPPRRRRRTARMEIAVVLFGSGQCEGVYVGQCFCWPLAYLGDCVPLR